MSIAHTHHYGAGIYAIDSGYERPGMAAVHLMVERGHAALIDTATNGGVPRIMATLTALDIDPAAVDYIILTHIHLDHAGAASTLMQLLPNARLLVHPRGAFHMAKPERLIASATSVYGAAEFARMYGDILPIDSGRISAVKHQEHFSLNGRRLMMQDTPGHARHHICIRDDASGHFFTGDTFGLSYRELDSCGHNFVFPTTTPVQYEPESLHHSIDLLMSQRPAAMYLTHFGQVTDTLRLARNLHRLIRDQERLAIALANSGPDRLARLQDGITELMLAEAERDGWGLQGDALISLMAKDIELNAQGLDGWLNLRS